MSALGNFKLGTLMKIRPLNEVGRLINIRKDRHGEILYDVEREDGETHVCRKIELEVYTKELK